MRLTRVFVDQPLAGRQTAQLTDDAANHVARVLRLVAGDALVLFDGRGGEFAATISQVDKRSVDVALGAHDPVERESPLRVTLLQGMARGERMDLIIQKATELGVHAIRPLRAVRSSVKLDATQAPRKLEHWQAVAISACEQSGRNIVPALLPPLTVAEACAADESGLKLMLAVDGARPLSALLQDADPARIARGITLLVGPEGGLDETEETTARRSGFASTLLGPRVLRTETAPLAALAALQVLAGDFAS